jgi:hypothetical protein
MVQAVKRDDVLVTTVRMLEHCAQCARRGQHGEWVLTLGDPRHDYRVDSAPISPLQVSLGVEFLQEVSMASGAMRPPIYDDPINHVEADAAYNVRPVDRAWIDRVDQQAEAAAKELGAFIVLIAVQELGKLAFTVGGNDLPGDELKQVKEMSEDMPRFLHMLADVAERLDEAGRAGLVHGKQPKRQ